jgi:hypothetical protein
MVGKSTVGRNYAGRKEASLAEPLYALARMFLGSDDKTVPGVREFLQTVGQWGRGTVSEKYPRTLERGIFSRWARERFPIHMMDDDLDYLLNRSKVHWATFGSNEDIWIDALCARMGSLDFCSNCRFENELAAFTAKLIPVFHVTCRADTLGARWRAANVSVEALTDISESLATRIDCDLDYLFPEQVRKKYGLSGIIWNDERFITGPSSPEGMLTVEQFVAIVNA